MKKLFSFALALTLFTSLAAPALAIGAGTGQIITAKYGASPDNALYSAAATAPSAPGFSDVPADHNFYSAIMNCSELGIIGGYGDGTFRPVNPVSRSNFTVMLSRGFYTDEVAVNKAFEDIGGKFMPNYWTLFQAGVLEGTSFGHEYDLYNGDTMGQPITRYDMAQLMTNIMDKLGFAADESKKAEAISKISDYDSIPNEYKDAVANVYALGVIGGYSDGSFSGEVTMNRGQAAVVIFRMMQYAPTVPGGVDPTPVDPTPVDPTPVELEIPEVPETPVETPETPVAGKTLANGKAITVENVSEVLAQLKSRYPGGTDFSGGYSSLSSGRYAHYNCIDAITRTYTRAANQNGNSTLLSTIHGCGGWTAFVADEIFGQKNVTWRKTTMSNVRPGDLLIKLDSNGRLMHVCICAGYSNGFTPDVQIQTTDASGDPYAIFWSSCWTNKVPGETHTYDVYTAYPD